MRCPDEEVGGFAEEEKAMAARILVADDSVTIQKVVELTFSKEDFVLVQARSGEEAIRKAKEERPDLVLLDLVMPDKNGYEVCAALRAEPMLRAVPVILLAGTFEAFDKDKGIQAGASDFVTKPFESQVLISKVKQLLFNKTVTTAPAAPAKTAAPKEATQQAPPKIVPPAGMVSRPAAASAATPGPHRGTVPPSPAPPQAPRPAAMASGASGIPTPSAATPMGQVLPRAEPPKKYPLPAAPVT
ncbi:MAG TPA: response regulator, partial [Candidatus Methylomirabilis sp.]|nr:response regulator [Candidatus Methylomirabilis sp.]